MTLHDLRARRLEIQEIAAKHGVSRIRVFGSVARGEDRPDSDVDFLVEAGSMTSSWFPAGLILDLQAALGRRVEVVEEVSLRPSLRNSVVREAIPL
jgi:predicted nucleotidyltransferase